MDIQIERTTFAGHYGSETITFVCIKDGRYAILRNDLAVGVWGVSDYAYCLNIFLRMIERPTPVESEELLACQTG